MAIGSVQTRDESMHGMAEHWGVTGKRPDANKLVLTFKRRNTTAFETAGILLYAIHHEGRVLQGYSVDHVDGKLQLTIRFFPKD